MRLHFQRSDYDFFRYRGRLKLKDLGKDGFHYESLAMKFRREDRVIKFFLANFLRSYQDQTKIDGWIGNYRTKEAFDNVEWYDRNINSLSYRVSQLLSQYSLKELLDPSIKKLYKLYVGGKIDIILFVAVVKSLKLDRFWEWTDDPLMEEVHRFILKVMPFLEINTKRIQNEFTKQR